MKKRGITFKRDIHRLNICMSSGKRIKKTAMELFDTITVQILKAVCREAGNLVEHSDIKVLGAKSVEGAVKMLFPGEMSQYAVEEARAACLKYQQYEALSSSSV